MLYADEIGREVMDPGGDAYDGILEEFGPDILDLNGRIRRPALAALVFSQPERLAVLNQIVHPAVYAKEELLMSEFARKDPSGIAVLEAAILIETGSYKRFPYLILTFCSPEEQVTRAVARGLTPAEAEARLAVQMPLAAKIPYASYLIDTSGTRENTVEQTREVYRDLRSKVT